MQPALSRRRAFGAAAAFAAAAVLVPFRRAAAVRGQAIDARAALERLFGAAQINPDWFAPALLQRVTPERLQATVTGFSGLFGAFQSVQPGKADRYRVTFAGGSADLRVTVDDQGRIATLLVTAIDYALATDEQEIQFTSGSDTLYGTLLLPAGSALPADAAAPPAALLIAGSGPTDRNGNSPLAAVQVNTLAALARALAAAGVASLRYDKLGAGKTGSGGHALAEIDFTTFVDDALAAAAALTARPEVDATRLLLAGHSEGGLFAELLAQQLPSCGGLLLAAPLGTRALDTLRRQLVTQFDAALAAGRLTQDLADRLSADLDRTIASIRESGTIPDDVFVDVPAVQAVFTAATGPFWQQEDRYDPAEIARQLPASLPVLLLHGSLDMNVDQADIQRLADAFQAAGNTSVQRDEFAGVDHELRQLPPDQEPSLASVYPIAPAVQDAVTSFAAALFG